MICSPETLALIKAGKKTSIVVRDNGYKPNRCYAIQTQRGQQAQAHVTVRQIIPLEANVCELRFELGDQTDRPRLLRAKPGGLEGDYTENPQLAMRGEPEAVSEPVLAAYGEEAGLARELARAERRQGFSATLAALKREMAQPGLASPRERKLLKLIQHELAKK